MNMNKPIILSNVIDRIAGEDVYSGELVLTNKALYFIPVEDRHEKNLTRRTSIAKRVLLPAWSLFIIAFLLAGRIESKLLGNSVLQKMNIYTSQDTVDTLEEKLSSLFKNVDTRKNFTLDLKTRLNIELKEDLPLPQRYSLDDIKNLSFSFIGILKFDAQYDQRTFKVGLLGKGVLKKGLSTRD